MTIKTPEIQENEVKISTLEELKKELNINDTGNIEEFKTPITLTKEELARFREQISKTPEGEKLEKIKIFIQEKAKISVETENKLNDLMGDGTITGVLNTATKDIKKDFEEISKSEGIGKIDKIFGFFDKIGDFWDKLVLGFSRFMWKIAPSIAKFFGIENPASQIKEEAKEAITDKLQEKQTALNESIKEQTKPDYSLYGKIYFKLFSSKNELQEIKWVDDKLEQKIANDLISHNNIFLNLKYNELKDASINDKLYNELIKLDPKYKDISKDDIKKHIDIIIKNIVGGDIEYTTGFFFKETKKEKLTKGSEFIKKMYEAKGKDIEKENPSIKEIFENLNVLKDFDIFLNNSIDLEEIFKSTIGKLHTFLSSGKDTIANISEIDFLSLKDKLSKGTLENMTNFKAISVAILGSHSSRTLENHFKLAENNIDGITKITDKQLIEQFIGNENEGLIKFGNEIYENIFKSGKPISGLDSVQKSDLTLKDIYRLYIITGGESNIDKLNPIQKMNLTASLLVGFSSAEGLGQKLGKISKRKNIEISPDVQDMLIRIGNTAIDITKTALKATGEFSWGFAKENTPLRVGIILILWNFPFITRKQSISSVILRK